MKILHICNDYCGSKVHANLYRELDARGVEQTVYTYYRGGNADGKNRFEGEHTEFLFRPILRGWHRVLYHQKIRTVYADLLRQTAGEQHDLAHATTLFSDGAVAYRLWRKRGTPYVVTVRNTDINEFLAVAPWTWAMGMSVLRHARRIIFISKAPMEKFCRHALIRRILPEIRDKFVLQPNGVDDYWLEHVATEMPARNNHNIIYVGRFDMNKNVLRLAKAVLALSPKFPDVQLHLVGGGGSQWGG